MANFGLDFGDHKQFSDWTKYAGLDKASFGVPPPSATGKTAMPPTVSQIGTTMSNVGGQLGQGNVMGAMRAYQGGSPVAAIPALPALGKPAAVDKDGDGMISEWEE